MGGEGRRGKGRGGRGREEKMEKRTIPIALKRHKAYLCM